MIDSYDEALLEIGKQCLELAGCTVHEVFMGANSPKLFHVVLPDDGKYIPEDHAGYSAEEAWLMASRELLTNEKTCIEVLVQAFETWVSLEHRMIGQGSERRAVWIAFTPVHDASGYRVNFLNASISESLPLTIALWFLDQRGVKIDMKYVKALEAKE